MRNRFIGVMLMGVAVTAQVSATVKYELSSGGMTVHSPGVNVRLQVYGDKIVRVSATPDDSFPPTASLVVVPPVSKTEYNVTAEDDRVILTTKDVKAVVDGESGAVTFYDKAGVKILQESVPRVFKPISAEGCDAYSVSQCFESLNDSEGIYGLGQHQSNEFNYKGKNEELFQYNTKVSVPFVVSTDNYGLLWDSYSLCRWGNDEDYRQLGDVFTLYDKDGKRGCLTGTYTDKDGVETVRDEPAIYFEHLTRGDLGHVVNLPRDFRMAGSRIVYEGELEPAESGEYDFIMYYSGYQTISIDGRTVVPRRWRTAWNPNSYKFTVNLERGKRVPVRIEWEPNGSVAYCGLRAYSPVDTEQRNRMRWWGEMQDMIDYYFVYGESMDDVVHGYRRLTGKSPIMPRWAMGYWQSREKYNTQDEVLSTFAEFRRRHIPIDNIVIDWLHWPQDAWGSHEFDAMRFPDPKGMVDSIHALDGRVMISVWPKFYVTTEHYKEFDRRGWMYQGAIRDSIRDWVEPGYLGSFYDAYHPEARKLFWSQINDHYMPLGIDAWWMDASEPNIRDCTDIGYRKELMTPTALGPAAKYFNAYPLMNADAIYNGQRSVDPDRRVFLLTRSGFAGLQRYSTATWSGDIATRWEDMEAQISAGLNYSISGIPYWTMDIGGFCVEDRYVAAQRLFDATGQENDDLREWRELNTRWYQFGCFVPLFRAHGQWPSREVYNIAPEDHEAYKSIVFYLKLRYRLMPYIYSLAGMTYHDDYTIMRPMVMDFTGDINTREIKDQYMFGPALMVAPVYKYGARSRQVYFPTDEKWYDFYTGSVVRGEGMVTVDAPYSRIPLYVRGGSIIPMGGNIQSTAQQDNEPTTLLVFSGKDGRFTLYEDEGVNYNYEKGICSRIEIEYSDSDSRLTLRQRQGSYPGMSPVRQFIVLKIGDDKPQPIDGIPVDYDGSELSVKI